MFDRPTSESAPSGRLATLNSLQGPTRSRPVREFRTSGVICVGSLFNFSIVQTLPLFLERRPEVQRVASLSSTAAGLLRDFFKSSSGALYFKKSLRRQGIGFRRCLFRPFASAHCMSAVLRKTTAPYVSVHFRNVCLGEARSSTLHRPVGQRSAARHSLWAGQARTSLR